MHTNVHVYTYSLRLFTAEDRTSRTQIRSNDAVTPVPGEQSDIGDGTSTSQQKTVVYVN